MKHSWKKYACFLLGGWLYASTALANTLTAINYNVLSNQSVQATLQFSDPISAPKSFNTDQPARIILDFFGVDKSALPANSTVNRSFLATVNTISADGRTRVIMNLQQPTNYQVQVQGNRAIVTLTATSSTAATSSPTKVSSYTAIAPTNTLHTITGIDFRRNNNGGGDVIISMSDADTVVNVNQENKLINVELLNTRTPANFQKRLDVTDFATPAQFITLQNEGKQALVQIQATGGFEQLSYQVNKKFIISINPLSAAKQAEKQAQPTYTGKPISLNFQDIPIRSVLEVIGEFTGINIVASDAVKGNITLRLNNIPWDEALDIILKSSGLGKKQVGDVIMIAPSADIAAQEKQALTAQQDVQGLEPLQTEYMRLNYAKASDVSSLIKDQNNSLLSTRGNVTVDQRTNTLIVQDTDGSLVNIHKLVNQIDIPVQQVLIEARIVNVDTRFEQDIGVQFGVTKPEHVTGTLTGANQMVINYQTGVVNPVSAVPLNQRLNVDLAANPTSGIQAPSIGVALANLGNGYLLDLELSALETEGGGELISSPRLVTANQHEAVIEQGTEIPYQEATSSGATSVQFKKAVLSLKVTPQITPDNKIIMQLKVTQDKVNPTLSVADVPAIDTREVETNVLVNNGETIVLGGIYEEEKRHTVNRVPFLGSIPLFGALFRNTQKINDKTELLIFITPKIIQQIPITE
jgi:type IV pilus assembly protein PilQ